MRTTAGTELGSAIVADRELGGTPVTRQVLDILVAWGVARVYCCPGSTEAAMLDAFVGRDDIELVLVSHESTAIAAADAEARLSGGPAVVYVHTNVGLANVLAHLSAARIAYAPVLILNGLKPSVLAGRDGFTTLPHPDLGLRDLVKWDRVPATPDSLPADLERALSIATAEPAGPVWLGLPQELLETTDAVDPRYPRPLPGPRRSRPSRAELRGVADVLTAATRVVLVSGGEVARHGASDLMVTLAERLDATVLHEDRRGFERSSYPTQHPAFQGSYDVRHPAVANADVVVFAGCQVFREFDVNGAPALPTTATVVHVHVDPSRIGRLHQVDHALVGHTGEVVRDLLDALGPRPATTPARAPTPASGAGPSLSPHGSPAHHGLAGWVSSVAEALTGEENYVVDATTAGPALLGALPQTRPDQVLTTSSGSLGWGLGAAIGVALAQPERRVLAFLGDGVFQFGLAALWTAQRYRAQVTFVVLNNEAFAAVGLALGRFGGEAVRRGDWLGTDLSGPHLAQIAGGFGLPSERVLTPDGVAAAIERGSRSRGPSLVELMTSAREE